VRWTWSHTADPLWETADPAIWARTQNPWLLLQNVSPCRLEQLAQDEGFHAELRRLVQARRDYLTGPTWFDELHPTAKDCVVAYFSMEYGLAEALPLYSGGIGILAGAPSKPRVTLAYP